MSKELYKILNVPSYANITNIQESYLHLKNKFKKNNEIKELVKVNEAYNVISNLQMRKLYDQGILDINLNVDLESGLGNLFFENITLKNFLKHNKNNKSQGKDINLFVDISLAEAYIGCRKQITYSLKMPCKSCAECCSKCLGKKYSIQVKSIVQGLNRLQESQCIECNELGYVYNKYSTDKCTYCTGTGKLIKYIDEVTEIPQDKYMCNICNGTKKYLKNFREPIYDKKICIKCYGKGSKKDVACNTCNSNGYLLVRTGYQPICKIQCAKCEDCDENGMVGEKFKTVLQKKTIFYDCDKCNGKGVQVLDKDICKICNNMFYLVKNNCLFINLYPGIENGKQFIIPKNGEQILEGNPGNLIITINIINNSLFKRIENNLKLTLIIHFVKTIVGAAYKIILPSNEIIIVDTKKFKEIINPLKLYIYKNKGMPIYDLEKKTILSYGDLYIQFNIIYGKISPEISTQYMNDLEILFSKIYDTLDDTLDDTSINDNNMTIIEHNVLLDT